MMVRMIPDAFALGLIAAAFSAASATAQDTTPPAAEDWGVVA